MEDPELVAFLIWKAQCLVPFHMQGLLQLESIFLLVIILQI